MFLFLSFFTGNCNLFEKDESDNTLGLLALAALLGNQNNSSNCSDDSRMVICIPPGFVQQ